MTIEGGITEGDIANYLANTPGFFERHSELLAAVQITSPHGQRAVSLQERQMEMLRERIKGLELKIVEMIRHSQENLALANRQQRLSLEMLLATDAGALPQLLVDSLKQGFRVPAAAVRLWGADAAFGERDFAQDVTDDVKSLAASLSLPYCGVNSGFEAASWLLDSGPVLSMAMIPLLHDKRCFGLLVLGSPDPTRYAAEMGTEFLQRIGELAGAALARLLPRQPDPA